MRVCGSAVSSTSHIQDRSHAANVGLFLCISSSKIITLLVILCSVSKLMILAVGGFNFYRNPLVTSLHVRSKLKSESLMGWERVLFMWFHSFSLCQLAICLRGQLTTSSQCARSASPDPAPISRCPTSSFFVIWSQSSTTNSRLTPDRKLELAALVVVGSDVGRSKMNDSL